MTIRVAKFGDIPQIVGLLREAHSRSIYSDAGDINEKVAKALVMNAIQRHGHAGEGGTFTAVASTDGKVTGFIIAVLQRVYLVGDKLQAQEMFWFASKDVHPRDPAKLMRAMHRWAGSQDNVIEIITSTNEALGDSTGPGRILERLGSTPFGSIYRKELT